MELFLPRFAINDLLHQELLIRQSLRRSTLVKGTLRFELQVLHPHILTKFDPRLLRGPERRAHLSIDGKLNEIDGGVIPRVCVFGEVNQFKLLLHAGQIGVCCLLGQSVGFTLFTLFVACFAQKPLAFWVFSNAKTQMQYKSILAPSLNGYGMLTVSTGDF
jgi:hypothetical protein